MQEDDEMKRKFENERIKLEIKMREKEEQLEI